VAFSVAGSNSDGFFLVETPVGARFSSRSQDHPRPRGETSSSCDNGQCQHVKVCWRQCRAAHFRLLSSEGKLLRTPVVD
jgi:hypothetical protein